MRGSVVVSRLVLPGAMASFLLLALAYWWLDNLPHELFGTAMFGLLAWHIVVNCLWFRNLLRGRYDARRVLSVMLHLLLIGNMVVLLVTSIAISKSVFALLPFAESTLLREIHRFAAYWVMILVGVHIGLHWSRVMTTTRSLLYLSPPGLARTARLVHLRVQHLVRAATHLVDQRVVAEAGLRLRLAQRQR